MGEHITGEHRADKGDEVYECRCFVQLGLNHVRDFRNLHPDDAQNVAIENDSLSIREASSSTGVLVHEWLAFLLRRPVWHP